MKHSNNNRGALTIDKYVNIGTSAQVTSSEGHFDTPIYSGQYMYFLKKMPARYV